MNTCLIEPTVAVGNKAGHGLQRNYKFAEERILLEAHIQECS